MSFFLLYMKGFFFVFLFLLFNIINTHNNAQTLNVYKTVTNILTTFWREGHMDSCFFENISMCKIAD